MRWARRFKPSSSCVRWISKVFDVNWASVLIKQQEKIGFSLNLSFRFRKVAFTSSIRALVVVQLLAIFAIKLPDKVAHSASFILTLSFHLPFSRVISLSCESNKMLRSLSVEYAHIWHYTVLYYYCYTSTHITIRSYRSHRRCHFRLSSVSSLYFVCDGCEWEPLCVLFVFFSRFLFFFRLFIEIFIQFVLFITDKWTGILKWAHRATEHVIQFWMKEPKTKHSFKRMNLKLLRKVNIFGQKKKEKNSEFTLSQQKGKQKRKISILSEIDSLQNEQKFVWWNSFDWQCENRKLKRQKCQRQCFIYLQNRTNHGSSSITII